MGLFDYFRMLTKEEREFVKNSGDKDLKKRMRTFNRIRNLAWATIPIASYAICNNNYNVGNMQFDRFETAMSIRRQLLDEKFANQEITAEEFDMKIKEIEKERNKFEKIVSFNNAIKDASVIVASSIVGAVTIRSIDSMAASELHDFMDKSTEVKNIKESKSAEAVKKFISGGNKSNES